jgi:hypothetical protein
LQDLKSGHWQSPSEFGEELRANDGHESGWGAGSLPTHRKRSGSLDLRPEMKPLIPVPVMLAMTSSRLKPLLLSSRSAVAPATWGHAMDVPLKDLEVVSEEADAETMALPGAMMLLHFP